MPTPTKRCYAGKKRKASLVKDSPETLDNLISGKQNRI